MGGENVVDLTDLAKPNLVYNMSKERAEIRGPNVRGTNAWKI